ncbi:MAG: molybdenum cofactor guanylyltransferase, partial [Desulfuromonadaceae bacterium]|nr:molybdenum cofactor guanylyltransferase [Desulfuromonadaceae bacterium]
MSTQSDGITAVLLAGGRSRRMGYDKRDMVIGGTVLLERLIDTLRSMSAELLVIANDPAYFASHKVQVFKDIYPGSSLGGLYTGLYHASTARVFVTACDMPFFNSEVAKAVIRKSNGYDVGVVKTASGYEPLFACYGKSCLAPMQRQLEQGNYRIHTLLHQLQECLRIREIEAEELTHIAGFDSAFININRPEDLTHTQRLLDTGLTRE